MRNQVTRSAIALCIALISSGSPNRADADAAVQYTVDVPAESLSEALKTFASQTNLEVVYYTNVAESASSAGVSGSLSASAALKKILSGTGLTFQFLNERTVAIRAVKPQEKTASQSEPSAQDRRIQLAQSEQSAQHVAPAAPPPNTPAKPPEAAGPIQERSQVVDEIIVTARRVAENLQDVPTAITAFRAGDLEAKQIRNAGDLLYNVPSLSVSPGPTSSTPNYGIRGQRQGIGNATGVVTYLGDIPVDGNTSYHQTFDLASLQVLKGPQGTLFGANSNGGAILFVPKAPSDHFEAEFEADVGSYDLRQATVVLNVPIIDDRLSVRVSGRIVNRAGYTKNVNPCPLDLFTGTCGRGGAQDDEKYDAFRIGVSAKITDWLKNDFTYYDTYDHSIGPSSISFRYGGPIVGAFFSDPIATLAGIPTAASDLALQQSLGVRKVYSDEVTLSNRNRALSNVTAATLGKVTIKNIFGYQSVVDSIGRDEDGSRYPGSWQGTTLGGAEPVKTYTDELQFLGSALNNRISFVSGLFISRERDPGQNAATYIWYLTQAQTAALGAFGLGGILPIAPVTGVEPNAPVTTDSNAAYANFTWDLSFLTEGLSFSGGYRYTKDKSQLTAPQNLANGVCATPPQPNSTLDVATCTRFTNTRDSGSNYAATLQYKISDQAMVYFTSRHGFKPGGPNTVLVQDPAFLTYKPEKITDYELGLKSDFSVGDVRVRANIAVYTSTYKNAQRSEVIPEPGGLPAIVTFNAQKSTIRGIEPELDFQVTSNLDLGVFYSYLDAHYDQYLVPEPDGTIFDKTNDSFSAVSKNTVGVNANYQLPLDNRYGVISVGGNFYYRSAQTFAESTISQPSDLFVPGYSTTNLRIDWQVPRTNLRLAGSVTNVFDKTYAVGGADYTQAFVGYAIKQYGPPRMFRVEFAYRY